jgi:hypothetical protein
MNYAEHVATQTANQSKNMTPQEKQRLIDTYTPNRYPHLLAVSGPWEIRQSATGAHCAAIPTDPASGHLPSHYGVVRDVRALIRAGVIQPV